MTDVYRWAALSNAYLSPLYEPYEVRHEEGADDGNTYGVDYADLAAGWRRKLLCNFVLKLDIYCNMRVV